MEKRNTLLLTVIAVATLLVAVVGATFAYFASTSDTNNTLGLNATTVGSTAQFTATAETIEFTVTPDLMQQSNTNETEAKFNDSGNLTVTFSSGSDTAEASCTYDIIWNWTQNENYFAHSKLDGQAITGKEFTIQAAFAQTGDSTEGTTDGTNNIEQETDFSDTLFSTGTAAKTDVVVVSGATIYNKSESVDTVATWTFTSRFYNRMADQSDLANKSYIGNFKVDNVVC